MLELKKGTRNEWYRFLQTTAGQEVMLFLRERTPGITAKEEAGIILEAGISEGHRRCLDLIESTTNAAEPTREVNYENQ